MNKKLKLTSLAIGITVFAAPAIVTSCGFRKKKIKMQTAEEISAQVAEEQAVKNQANKTKIKVGVRVSELDVYQHLAEKFNKYNKGQVEILGTDGSSFKDLYDTKAASNQMPTVFVNDSNSMSVITNEHKWAGGINVEDFLGTKNAELYNIDKSEKSYKKTDINSSHLNANSDSRSIAYGLPVGYGTKGLVINTTMIDSTKHIHSFVPSKQGGKAQLKEVDYGNGQQNDFGEATIENIQKYLSEAGDKTAASSHVVQSDENSDWLGYGPGNVIQRIYSIALSTLKQEAIDAGVMAMALKEGFANFGILASSGVKLADGSKIYNQQKKMLETKDFNKIMSGDHFNKDLSDYLWNSIGGYMTGAPAGIINSDYLTKEAKQGEVEPFFNKQTLFTWNAKWAAKMANDQWAKPLGNMDHSWKDPNVNYEDGKGYSSKQIQVLSSPYGEVTGDSISINIKAKPEERLVAKRWMKFLLQTDSQFEVGPIKIGKKPEIKKSSPAELISLTTVSSLIPAKEKQLNNISNDEHSWKDAWFHYGDNNKHVSSDPYNGIDGQVWKITDSNNLSGIFEPYLRDTLQTYYNANSAGKNTWTRQQFNDKLDEVLKQYNAQLALR